MLNFFSGSSSKKSHFIARIPVLDENHFPAEEIVFNFAIIIFTFAIMSTPTQPYVCPAEYSGSLDNRLRRWLQNPEKILKPYIRPGMKILDIGCGPGYFTLDMARMTGPAGHVFAADLQPGMLEKLQRKIRGSELGNRITPHQCESNRIGLDQKVDFILAFYMVHEVPDRKRFLAELHGMLNPGGSLLIIEPKFHVTRAAFEATRSEALSLGFTLQNSLRSMFSRGMVLER